MRFSFNNWVLLILLSILTDSCSKSLEFSQNPKDLSNSKFYNSPDFPGIVPDDQNIVNPNKIQETPGFIYTLTNEIDGNRVVAFRITSNGMLEKMGNSEFGGIGTGKSIPSQGSLTINEKKDFLFAVNIASNNISSFKIQHDGSLTLVQTIQSGGIKPVSVTVYNNLLYVLNAGTDNLNGFKISDDGTLSPIEGSSKILSGKEVGGAQISFAPTGNYLIVTEKFTNKIGSYRVMENGKIGDINFTPSSGDYPYGFAFSGNHHLIVSQAWHGVPQASSTSSYTFNGNGSLKQVRSEVSNFQTAACWATTSQFGNYAYISNGDGNSISSYSVSEQGDLRLIEGVAASTGQGPRDMIISKDNTYLYVVTKGNGIEIYKRKPKGQLIYMGNMENLPSSISGIAINQ